MQEKIKFVKKTVYDELIKNLNAVQTIDAGNLDKKADYNTKIAEIEKKNLIMIIVNKFPHKNLIIQ